MMVKWEVDADKMVLVWKCESCGGVVETPAKAKREVHRECRCHENVFVPDRQGRLIYSHSNLK